MTESEFDRCYSIWPKTRRKKGVALSSWKKHKPPVGFYDWIIARNRYCREANINDCYRRLFSTAINQHAWEDEIPSHGDIDKSGPVASCSCGAKATVQQFCTECWQKISPDHNRAMDDLRGSFKRNVLVPGESKEDQEKRCKAIGQAALANAKDLLRGMK